MRQGDRRQMHRTTDCARPDVQNVLQGSCLRLRRSVYVVIAASEVEKRLNGAIDRLALDPDRERMARYVVTRLVPPVLRLILEQVREVKSKGGKS